MLELKDIEYKIHEMCTEIKKWPKFSKKGKIISYHQNLKKSQTQLLNINMIFEDRAEVNYLTEGSTLHVAQTGKDMEVWEVKQPLRDVPPVPGTCEHVTFHGKRDFADVL